MESTPLITPTPTPTTVPTGTPSPTATPTPTPTVPVGSTPTPTPVIVPTQIPLGQVFVWVNGVPVVVPASELPGTLNIRQHFNCGDTIEFVIHTSFTDTDRYQVSAAIYAGSDNE